MARRGSQAPGTTVGTNFILLNTTVYSLNNAGQTAFRANLNGAAVSKWGIWAGGVGGLDLIARSGNQAPGTPAGVDFSGFSNQPALNDAGQMAFFGGLVGPGVNITNNEGIWSDVGGSLALVARTGDPAPGTAVGVNFSRIDGRVVLNSAGQTAFWGRVVGPGVTGGNDGGIWSEGGGGGLALVAREGEPAPGMPVGVNFAGFDSVVPVLNGEGQAAFKGWLTGAGVTASNNRGIWAEDASGVLTLIAREGDVMDVDDGPGIDFRVIDTLSFLPASNFSGTQSGNEDGLPSAFNDKGQVAFHARFSGGTSGVFIANTIAVPGGSGDLDFDLDVDGFDFLKWQRGFGVEYDASHLANWEAQYGSAAAAVAVAAVVPEPTTFALTGLGLSFIAMRRRR